MKFYKKLIAPLIVSLVVAIFAGIYHYLRVSPNDWAGFFVWMPVYLVPIWIFAGLDWLMDKGVVDEIL